MKKTNPEHIKEILKRVMEDLKKDYSRDARGNYRQDLKYCWRKEVRK